MMSRQMRVFATILAARFVKKDFNWLQFEEDFDIIMELEGWVAQPSV